MDQRRKLRARDLRHPLTARKPGGMARAPETVVRIALNHTRAGKGHEASNLQPHRGSAIHLEFRSNQSSAIEESRIAYGPDVPVRQLTNDREIADFLSSFDVARRVSG